MQSEERSCLEGLLGTFFWLLVIYIIIKLLAIIICCIGYVIWIAFLKPILEAIDNWIKILPRDNSPLTEQEVELLTLIIMTILLVPLGIWLYKIFPPLGVLVWLVNFVAALAILNPNNLFG